MEQLALGNSGRQTTRLGFGCSSLMGAMGRRESLAVLETAFDAGVRHFDVAPMYGYGKAESCLGEFLQRHRAEVTVTTKYGISPPKRSTLLSLGRRVAGPVVKRLPGLKQRLIGIANAAACSEEKPLFTAEQARQSLERSLAALRTDHIDVWLLHEVQSENLQDDSLFECLEDEVKKGTIGTFGIGSEAGKIGSLLENRPTYCRTLQYEWSALDAPIPQGESFRIHHRALAGNFHSLHTALTARPEVCQRWSASTGIDIGVANNLAALMLKAALVINPASVILFSSKNALHMRRNVDVVSDTAIEASARRFYQLLQTDREQLLPGAGAEAQ